MESTRIGRPWIDGGFHGGLPGIPPSAKTYDSDMESKSHRILWSGGNTTLRSWPASFFNFRLVRRRWRLFWTGLPSALTTIAAFAAATILLLELELDLGIVGNEKESFGWLELLSLGLVQRLPRRLIGRLIGCVAIVFSLDNLGFFAGGGSDADW